MQIMPSKIPNDPEMTSKFCLNDMVESYDLRQGSAHDLVYLQYHLILARFSILNRFSTDSHQIVSCAVEQRTIVSMIQSEPIKNCFVSSCLSEALAKDLNLIFLRKETVKIVLV